MSTLTFFVYLKENKNKVHEMHQLFLPHNLRHALRMRTHQSKVLKLWIILIVIAVSACKKEERTVQFHSNGLKKVVHEYQGDRWVQMKTFHMNNIRSTQVGVKNSQRHGAFTRWSTQGVKVEQGEFLEGDSSGIWTKFLSRTEKISEGAYQNGKKHGSWIEYWPQGTIKSLSHWDQGLQIGESQEYYYDSTLHRVHNCHENGRYKEFYYNSQIRYEYDCNESFKRIGQFQEYDILGHLIHQAYYNKFGQADLSWTWWNARGDITHQRQYRNGVLHGEQNVLGNKNLFENGSGRLRYPCADSIQSKLPPRLTFHLPPHSQSVNLIRAPDQTPYHEEIQEKLYRSTTMICGDTTYSKGLPHGISLTFESDAFLLVEQWNLGAKLWQTKYRLNDQNIFYTVSEGGFKNNLREGDWKVFNSKGQIAQRLNFEKDHYMGDQFFYDRHGLLTMKKTYQGKNQKVIMEIIDSVWRAKHSHLHHSLDK